MYPQVIELLPTISRRVVDFAARNMGSAAFSGLLPRGHKRDDKSYTGMNGCRAISKELCAILKEYGVEGSEVYKDAQDYHHMVLGQDGCIIDPSYKQFFTASFMQAALLRASQENPQLREESRRYLQELRFGFQKKERDDFKREIAEKSPVAAYQDFQKLADDVEKLEKSMAENYKMPQRIRQVIGAERTKSYGDFNRNNFLAHPQPTPTQARAVLNIFGNKAQLTTTL